MTFLSILGSPRRNGNTAKVLGWVEETLQAMGHDIDRVNIVDCNVAGCQECYACQQVRDVSGCAVKDDARALLDQMVASDCLLFSSPLFCWGFTAQLKALLDRGFCLAKNPGTADAQFLLQDKPVALLVTAAGPYEDNADLIVETYKRFCEYTKSQAAGHLVVPHCTTPEEIGDDVAAQARAFAQEIMPCATG